MERTIKQIIKEIKENKKTMFEFEGFNSVKHDELVNELCWTIRHKFNSRYLSENDRKKRAYKTIPDLKCYYILEYGIERNLTMEEICDDRESYFKKVMPSEEELQERRKRVLELLGI